jgi:precorrin-3B C17-methyltransferase
VVVGYTLYVSYVTDLTEGKEVISTGMRGEVERTRAALTRAAEGATVALVSSGDAGIYGMAGLAMEMAHGEGLSVDIQVVPGVSASQAAAARLGAPLMLDYATISLSDLLVPWEQIRRRLEAVAAADMVVALYNPRSKTRVAHLEEAVTILLKHLGPETPVGIGTAVGSEEESMTIATLGTLLQQEVNMRSIVIIGNSATTVMDNRLVTPRGYEL